MDTEILITWWENLRLVWAGLGLVLAMAMGAVLWRVRGLLSWKRSQRRQIEQLRQWRDEATATRRKALEEIIADCEAIWHSASPDLNKITELPQYWRRIAACYHPDEPQPELCLSIGQLLTAAQQLSASLDELLQRPGFDRLGRLRIRQLRRIYDWYLKFDANPVVSWMLAKRRIIRGFWHTLRFVLPDPLAWLAYLSQRLTVMMAGRCLLIDIYMSSGRIALDAFDAEPESLPSMNEVEASTEVLDAYEKSLKDEDRPVPDELAAIRDELIGLPVRLWNPPDMKQWRHAVEKAAQTIAGHYFPEAPVPLEEATCRVLLDRSRYWLQAMADARGMAVVKPFYKISLKRLMQIKAITESDMLQQAGKLASGAWTAWKWARWPVKVFRWIRRRSPAGFAVDMGFTLANKALLNFLARYSFDRACRELDDVYRLSSSTGSDAESNHADGKKDR